MTRIVKEDYFDGAKEKIERLRAALRMTLKEQLQTELTPSDAERLVGEMLRRDGNEATWTAGPSEQGADLIAATDHGTAETASGAIP